MSNRIYLFDTTLRDGEQSPGVSLNVEEKLEIAQQLARLGVDIIEAGFPVASQGDFNAVKTIADNVKGPVITGLCRATRGDIDRTWEAVKSAESSRIHTFLATSDIHLKHKLEKSREEALVQAVEAVKYAKKYCSDVEFSAEDASRSDINYLAQVVEGVIDAGATVVNLPDTVGYAVPEEFGQFIKTIMEKVSNIDKAIISIHCHDDLGMAVANSLAGIMNGARQVECAVNGIGERAGNASLEEIIMAIYTRKAFYDKEINVSYKELYRTSKMVSTLTGMSIQPNKAIVGKNAFSHESGIHQAGVLKEKSTYEIMSPELIGINRSNIVLGKHSGKHAFNNKLEELGFKLDEEELSKAFINFKEIADKKKEITDEDIEALIKEQVWAIPERFTLNYLHISSGTSIVPTATVKLTVEKFIFEAAATGDGPVDAACKAVDKITDIYGKMVDYKLNAVSSGKDALGEVLSQIKIHGKNYNGRGLSTDIIEASVKSYINAINKYYYEQQKDNGEI
ncbi:2-isopropylmalate synthase [Candidatus Syntrophocurvum alkaliphilum]|uniref:2-isopropylmalate synthase n=1 Tax=Candidatus Syntrophocurvum alkaliphilum TaxID=2293317 RepID=A0A6I6DE62_9FIRM|nr:2-isopropylmalate synthase [Candidatus Syntrophocurvum alkaliphilum]QGU00845.1 2-isopropylmalate synthase [Candidatus Syntrophocurvum alkaliphilum]